MRRCSLSAIARRAGGKPATGTRTALRRIRGRDPVAQVLMFSMYEDPVFALRSVAPAEDLSRQLSPREFEVLRLLVAGVPLRDFVRQLALTPKTVANYQSILRQKLGAENTLQLLQVATRMGIAQESGLA